MHSIALFVVAAVLLGQSGAALAQPASLPASDELYARIRERYRPMYEKYQGVEDRSRIETRRYNSKTKEIKESSQFVAAKRNYFYQKSEQRVLKTIKDGVETEAKEEWSAADEPLLPIWDADGPRHYRVQVIGRDEYRGKHCYLLGVEPKKKTKHHFAGTVRVNAETLDLIMLEGSAADIPLGVDAAHFTAWYRQVGDVALYDAFEMEVFANVPLIYPNVRFVWQSQVLESWPIPK